MINLASNERPRRYDEAIGQETNVRILKNMSMKDAFAKAYCFVGVHGSGKTSLARVTAMAANCRHKLPDGEPCGECETCRKIMSGDEVDVVEIDAASNNSVERARELIEESRFQPFECKTKVYIIDEAHMLSNGAFNALLKLLEEPPAWCMYILCTTERAKIPATIISRCTQFTFKAISFEKIAEHLKRLVAKYDCRITDDAAYAIASHSGGSMRDAIRDLEKCLSETMEIGVEDVSEALGFEPYEQTFRLIASVCDNNAAEIIGTCERYRLEGKDMRVVLSDVVSALTDLVMVAAGGKLAERGEGYMALLDELAEETTLDKALYLSKKFAEVRKNSLYDADVAAITVEMLRIASVNEQTVDALEVKVHDLEERLAKLEASVSSGAAIARPNTAAESRQPVKARAEAAEEVIRPKEVKKPEPAIPQVADKAEQATTSNNGNSNEKHSVPTMSAQEISDGWSPLVPESQCPFDSFDEDDEAYWRQVIAVAESMTENNGIDDGQEGYGKTELSATAEEAVSPAAPVATDGQAGPVKDVEAKTETIVSVPEPVAAGEPETVPDSVSSFPAFGGTGFGGVFDMFSDFGTQKESSKNLTNTFKERLEAVKAKDAEAADVLDKAEEVNIYKDVVEVVPLGYMETVTRRVLSRYEFIRVVSASE